MTIDDKYVPDTTTLIQNIYESDMNDREAHALIDTLRSMEARLKAADELNLAVHYLMEIDDESSKEFENQMLKVQELNWAYRNAGKEVDNDNG